MPRKKKDSAGGKSPAEVVRDLANKDLKSSAIQVASADMLADISGFVSTGWTLLDAALCGGVPLGRSVELYGPPSAGKSTLAYSILRHCQESGGLGVYFDMEHTFPRDFVGDLGVDVNSLLFIDDVTLDGEKSIFDHMDALLTRIRGDGKVEGPVVFVVDTLAAVLTEGEVQGDPRKALGPYKAQVISQKMRRMVRILSRGRAALVFVNHESKEMMTGGFGPPKIQTPGGVAPKFYATHRIRLREAGHIQDSEGRLVGRAIIAKIMKNKLGKPLGEVSTHLYYGRGFNDLWSVYDYLKGLGIITMAGAYSVIPTPSGDPLKTYRKDYLEKVGAIPGMTEFLQGMARQKYQEM